MHNADCTKEMISVHLFVHMCVLSHSDHLWKNYMRQIYIYNYIVMRWLAWVRKLGNHGMGCDKIVFYYIFFYSFWILVQKYILQKKIILYKQNWQMFSYYNFKLPSVQFSLVTQLCPTLCDPVNRSMPCLPVYHQLSEFTQTHVWVSHAIQPSHSLSSPSPPAPSPSQHQGLFQWVNSSQEVAKVLEFQL